MGRSFHDSPYRNRPKRQRSGGDKHLVHRHERRLARMNPGDLEELERDLSREFFKEKGAVSSDEV